VTDDGVTLYVHVTISAAIHCKEQVLTKANKELPTTVALSLKVKREPLYLVVTYYYYS